MLAFRPLHLIGVSILAFAGALSVVRSDDKRKKNYTSVWIDEMSTGMMITEGTADASGVVTSEGAVTDPLSGKSMKVKEVSTELDKDHRKYELHMADPTGGEKMMKLMEI